MSGAKNYYSACINRQLIEDTSRKLDRRKAYPVIVSSALLRACVLAETMFGSEKSQNIIVKDLGKHKHHTAKLVHFQGQMKIEDLSMRSGGLIL